MHCTNRIAIQKNITICESSCVTDTPQRLPKRKSFSKKSYEIAFYGQASKRRYLMLVNECYNEYMSEKEGLQYAASVRLMANAEVHNVHYLPSIDQSPTKLDTVQEILNQLKAKIVQLGLGCTDLILEHAIFA